MNYVRQLSMIALFITHSVCVSYEMKLPDNLKFQPLVHPLSSLTFQICPLSRDETKHLFGGEGRHLVQGRPSKYIQPLIVRITNNGDHSVESSSDMCSIPTLSKQELVYVLGKRNITRRLLTVGLASLIMIAPALLAAPLLGYVGLALYCAIADGFTWAALSFPLMIPSLLSTECGVAWGVSAGLIFGVGTPLVDHYALQHLRISHEVREELNTMFEPVHVAPGETKDVLVFSKRSDYFHNRTITKGWVLINS